MLSAKTLAMAEAVCREVRGRQMPFGGLQVVLVGDFFQLPPVRREVRDEDEQQISYDTGEAEDASDFAFASRAWKALDPLVWVRQEALEAPPVLAAHDAVPVEQPVDVADCLPIREFLLAQLRAVLAEMAGVAAAGEVLVRPEPSAAPAEVATPLRSRTHRWHQPRRGSVTASGQGAAGPRRPPSPTHFGPLA